MIDDFKLKKLRNSKSWTQERIATKLGIARRTYAGYENQSNMIPIEVLCKLAIIYNVSVDYICGQTQTEKPYGNFKNFNRMNFLNKLKYLRTANHLKQENLAEILYHKQNTISEYENGIKNISVEDLIILSKLYKLPMDYILDIVMKDI